MNSKIIIALSLLFFVNVLYGQTKYSLAECQRIALQNNNLIKVGKLDLETASHNRKEAFTNYFPSVSGTGTYFRANDGLLNTSIDMQGVIPTDIAAMLPAELLGALPSTVPISLLKDGMVGGVVATQPIFAGGRIINGNKLARVGEEISELQLKLTENQVELTTATYFWQIENLKCKLETIAMVEQLLSSAHKDVEMAVKAGLTTNNDLLRVELQEQQLASNRLKIENGIRLCKMSLAQFIGVDTETFDTQEHHYNDVQLPDSLYCDASTAVSGRFETQMIDKGVEVAQLKTKIARGQYLPSVAIGGGYLYNNLLGNSTNRSILFATVSIPISGWWGGSHAIKKSRLMEQRSDINRINSIEQMRVETNMVWNEVVETYKQTLIAKKSIESSEENLRIVSNSYKSGTISLTELLDAQVLFQQSRNQYDDVYSVYQTKVLKYRQITQR